MMISEVALANQLPASDLLTRYNLLIRLLVQTDFVLCETTLNPNTIRTDLKSRASSRNIDGRTTISGRRAPKLYQKDTISQHNIRTLLLPFKLKAELYVRRPSDHTKFVQSCSEAQYGNITLSVQNAHNIVANGRTPVHNMPRTGHHFWPPWRWNQCHSQTPLACRTCERAVDCNNKFGWSCASLELFVIDGRQRGCGKSQEESWRRGPNGLELDF